MPLLYHLTIFDWLAIKVFFLSPPYCQVGATQPSKVQLAQPLDTLLTPSLMLRDLKWVI